MHIQELKEIPILGFFLL